MVSERHVAAVRQAPATVEAEVVSLYSRHPSPSWTNKLERASRRMELRLDCCGVVPEDYAGKRVLDAGCGTGEYSCWFARQGGLVTGIDLSETSLAEARAYAAAEGLGSVSFERRSVLETGLPDAYFDLVYCTGVLHHVADPLAAVEELSRLLRSGGKMLISVYNSAGCLPRELRRRLAALLGGDDLDARARWGRRLFPRTSRRLLRGDRNDGVSALYDYFAVPHQSLHSAGEALGWLDRAGLDYAGSFAPLRLRDYLAMASRPAYQTVERQFRRGILASAGRRIAPRELERASPGPLSRGLVQLGWLLAGVGVFCVCGVKR